jgi:outer membrane receptor protein involved in Fe transport
VQTENFHQETLVMTTSVSRTRSFALRPIAFALGAAFSMAMSTSALAQAQTAEEKKEPLNLESIVVTGTTAATTKMKSSVSISTLSGESIERTGAQSAAEVLRSVPGVRSESSGGEGNANLTVRGVPISAGGARYVQFQEDGLPILLFGDIAFGTADQFLRADYNTDRLEVVRGGSASTLATNSPGGIINFISKTGEETGGAVGLGLGLDFRQTRADFDWGGKVAPGTRVHIGGFYRQGEADGRNADFNAQKGSQIKANITQELGGGNYIRASIKALDDRTPTFLPVPTRVVNGQIQQVPGVDPRTAFFITSQFPQDRTLASNGSFVTSDPKDGLRVKSNALGLEGAFNLGGGFKVENKFRTADNSGRFIGLFPSNTENAAQPGTFNGVLFNTSLDSLDNTFNDLKLTKTFSLGGSDKLNLSAGWFYGKQDVAQTWYWNTYLITLNGENSRVLGLVNDGTATFGGCCVRTWDVSYKTNAPYAALSFESGPLTVDGSVRRDEQKANGFTLLDVGTSPGAWNPASRQNVNYKVSKTSYSLGGNFAIDRNLALFARYSEGASFSADRLLYGNPLDGSVPINVNEVKQFETGVKVRSGPVSAFITAFNARTQESNYEVTTQTFTNNSYRANGIEFEVGAGFGDLRLNAGLTYTDAKITGTADGSNVGKTPRRQAKFVYQLQPTYSMGDWLFGAAWIGTTKSFGDDGNTITLPAYSVVNAFVNYQVLPNLTVSLSGNNLFNKVGYTEVEGDGHAARSINGRTIKAGVKYTF